MIKFSCFIISLFLCNVLTIAQHEIIPTETDAPISEIELDGDKVLILGKDGYFVSCTGDCTELTELTNPGFSEYSRNSLTVLNPDQYYLVSHKDFPHHGYVLKTDNGGESWEVLLDTTDLLFTGFFMFDEDNGSIITTFYRSIMTSNSGIAWTEGSHGLIGSSASLKVNDSSAVMGITEDFNYTTDKGVTWLSKSFPQSPPTSFYANHPDSVFAVTYGGTGTYFTYCLDIEESGWIKKEIDHFIPFGLYVKSINEIYIVGQFTSSETAGILKTNDLGEHWSFYDTHIEGSFYEIEFISDSTALIGGDDGLLVLWNSNSSFEMSDISEYIARVNIELIPNPGHLFQTLIFDANAENGCVILSDICGRFEREVFRGPLNLGENEIKIDIHDIPTGTYIYTVIVDDKILGRIKWLKI